MVSNEYLGRHPLAFDDTQPRQNGGAKSLPTMRHGARPHRPEHHWLNRQADEDFEFKDGDAGGMYMQDEVPTVRQIRLGRGALMRVRKSPKKELVGSWIRRVVFFFERCPCHLMGNANNLWQVR